MLKLYNSLTKKKEIFTPINTDLVRMYSCGPTVYHFAHIGNFRTYIMTDILNRALKWNGFKTYFTENITDVGHLIGDGNMGEDKLEKSAHAAGKTAKEIADFYTKSFLNDSQELNILKPNIYAKATEHIKEQIEMVKKLETLGFTYKTSDGIYFDTSKQKNYGALARLDVKGLKEGARVETNPEKKNETDFALWKFSPKDKQRQMEWPSPWGVGFPGWHIECSAMSIKYLGEPFDIHTGASDLLPVHHVNEIAQNEAVYGHKTVNYWIHGGFLLVNGGKMSKSLGTGYALDDIKKRDIDPLAFRYFTFSAQYRQPLNFTWQAIASAQNAYDSLLTKLSELEGGKDTGKPEINKIYLDKFEAAINNDLNMPEAISVVWEILKDKNVADKVKFDTIIKFDEVLGLSLAEKSLAQRKLDADIPKEILSLSNKRDEARHLKDWKKSDELRQEILKQGYQVIDTEKGGKISKLQK